MCEKGEQDLPILYDKKHMVLNIEYSRVERFSDFFGNILVKDI